MIRTTDGYLLIKGATPETYINTGFYIDFITKKESKSCSPYITKNNNTSIVKSCQVFFNKAYNWLNKKICYN